MAFSSEVDSLCGLKMAQEIQYAVPLQVSLHVICINSIIGINPSKVHILDSDVYELFTTTAAYQNQEIEFIVLATVLHFSIPLVMVTITPAVPPWQFSSHTPMSLFQRLHEGVN